MILVDADACPVIRLIEQIAEKYRFPAFHFVIRIMYCHLIIVK